MEIPFNIISSKPGNVIGKPIGLPPGMPSVFYTEPNVNRPSLPPPEIPGHGLPRAMNYLADYGGCSFYRCMGPNLLLNLRQKAIIQESTIMHLDPNIYREVKAVKIQRQATPAQREFTKFLKKMMEQSNGKVIYEIDDVTLSEDIPLYNKNREAFVSEEIRQSVIDIMNMCDEITVTCDYMRDYFKSKLSNQNITVIPNYLMKWWFDRHYDANKLKRNFDKNRKKPIVAIFASGTHVDVAGRNEYKDDFEPVLSSIIKARKEFVWKFYGSFPLQLKPYIDNGEIQYKPWTELPDFPEAMVKSEAQVTFASLLPNHFNKSKSNIKFLEASALGMPCICPDMCTYKDAFLKYNTGAEFIDQLKYATKDAETYGKLSRRSREAVNKFWLDDEKNLGKHYEAYFTPYQSDERKYLKECN